MVPRESILRSVAYSLMTWMSVLEAIPSDFQVIQSWEEFLLHQVVVLPSRGTSVSCSNGPTGTHEVQRKEAPLGRNKTRH